MNSSKSLLLLSLFFCTSVELLNSGLTQANELAPNSVDASSTKLYRPIAKTTDANRTEAKDSDPQDLHIISNEPINTILNPDSSVNQSDLALARRKKRITKPIRKKKGTSNTQPQIQNTPINTPPQVPTQQPQTQIQNTPINPPPQVPTEQPQTQIQNTPPQVPSGLTATQNQIQYKRNDLGVAVQFGNGTSFGIQGKVGLTDNISIRPEFFFGNGSGEVENKESIPNPVTLPSRRPVTFALLAPPSGDVPRFTAPVAVIVTNEFSNEDIIIIPRSFVTNAPLRNLDPAVPIIPAGTIIRGNTTIAEGTIITQGTYLPEGTITFSQTDANRANVVPVDNYQVTEPTLLTADYKASVAFIPNVKIGDNPAGTPIPAGTTFKAGTILSPGTIIPVDTRTSNTIPSAIPVGSFKAKTTTSTSYGLAVTYDFKLDPTGKSTAYLGPKIAFTSASDSMNVPNSAPITLNTNETKIGLVAGVDYVIFDGFTLGANANYYFSRSLNGSASSNGVSFPLQSVGGGSSTDFGLRIGYQF